MGGEGMGGRREGRERGKGRKGGKGGEGEGREGERGRLAPRSLGGIDAPDCRSDGFRSVEVSLVSCGVNVA